MCAFVKEVLQPNQLVRLKTLDRFVSYFGNTPRRLEDEVLIYLLITIKNGFGHCYVDNNYIPLKAGSTLLISPYSYLHLENTQYLLGNVIIFTEQFFCKDMFSGNLLYKVVYGMESPPIIQLGDDPLKMVFVNSNIQMFGSEYRLLKNKGSGNPLLFNLLMGIILVLHKVQLAAQNEKYDNQEQHLKSKVVEFVKLLNVHYKDQHQLDFYANQMGISVAALGKICREGCGRSPKELIRSKLIKEAKLMIIYDPRPLNDIGFELGFQEHNGFSRFFKDELKTSPMEFRTMNRNKPPIP